MELIKDRLAHILRSKNLTATQFAEMMEIQPSNVSHLLNGRNKPSIDFLMKLKEVFPEYSFDWIIMGKKPITINDPSPVNSDDRQINIEVDENVLKFDEINEVEPEKTPNFVEKIVENQSNIGSDKSIAKLIVVYDDNTFDIIYPNNN